MKIFDSIKNFFKQFLPRKPVYRLVKIGDYYAVQYFNSWGRLQYISGALNKWDASDLYEIRRYCLMSKQEATQVYEFYAKPLVVSVYIEQ